MYIYNSVALLANASHPSVPGYSAAARAYTVTYTLITYSTISYHTILVIGYIRRQTGRQVITLYRIRPHPPTQRTSNEIMELNI